MSETTRTILLVDDEPDMLVILADHLREVCTNLLTAADGREAFDVCRSQPVDAVLCDISMPRKNGLEFLADLLSNGISVPVVVLSAHGEKTVLLQALRLGAIDYLEKPVEEKTLIEVMARAVEIGFRRNHLEAIYRQLLERDGASLQSIVDIAHDKKMIGLLRALNSAKR